MDKSVQVDVYSRPGCHLCDEAKAVVDQVQKRLGFKVRVINIETDPALEKHYGEQVPVIAINGQNTFQYRVDAAELENRVKQLWKT